MMNLNLYIIYGSSILEIIQTFRTLIEQSYMPLKWAFGYQQCRWSYETEADVLDVVKNFKINQIPLDSI